MKHFYKVPTPEQQKAFHDIFKKPLNFFYDDITGFDLIKLDDWLKVPDGQSMENFILEKYGKEAVSLIRRLI